jgi:hypothetical protein
MTLDTNTKVSWAVLVFLLGLAFSAGKMHTDLAGVKEDLAELKVDMKNLNQVRGRNLPPGAAERIQ